VPVSTRNSPPPILIAALNRPMSSTQSGGHYFTVHLAGTDLPVRLRVRTGPVSTFRQQGNANDGPAIIPIGIGFDRPQFAAGRGVLVPKRAQR